MGPPRVSLAALADLHDLLVALGFRQPSSGDGTVIEEKQDEAVADNAEADERAPSDEHAARYTEAPGSESGGMRRSSEHWPDCFWKPPRTRRRGRVTMRASEPLPRSVLTRKAVVYVRQSTPTQVRDNLESQRRQYHLVDVARQHGFAQVDVIDDDLGLSAGGMVARPGFERLVSWLCAGEVGAVLCFEASRVARNGRDWHHLLELCGLVEARVIDHDGIYDPRHPNDRLLLGMKGTISEFELGVLRARMYDAARAKEACDELRISVPIGYVWDQQIGLGLDPDLRVQEAVRQVFARFRELGSARQVLLALTEEEVCFPRPSDGRSMVSFDWTPIRYRNVLSLLKNPFYAGTYCYGKGQVQTEIVDGHVRKSYGRRKPMEEWEVLLKDHHEGYIDWA